MKPFLVPVVFASLATSAAAFDRQTTDALQICHDYLWEVPDFAALPNAAISVSLRNPISGAMPAIGSAAANSAARLSGTGLRPENRSISARKRAGRQI